jgi:hypothetical protein
MRVGDARLDRCGGFLGCACTLLVLRPFLVESIYVLGDFNPFGDARQVEVSLVVLLGGVVPLLPAQELFAQERERVVVEVQGCALVVLLPCRNSAGAWSAMCSLSVVSCAIVSHVMPHVFVFRAFLESAAHLSCGMIGGRQEKYGTKK